MDQEDARIGGLIQRRRQELGLSINALSELTDISKGHLSHIESGARNPKPSALATLCGALGLPLADLYEAANIPLPVRLPSIRPYLRTAYGMPDQAVEEMQRYFERVQFEYGLPSYPKDGEDELPE